jgi:DeoR/GlpR family transcriptional regulator of sugar metabolism
MSDPKKDRSAEILDAHLTTDKWDSEKQRGLYILTKLEQQTKAKRAIAQQIAKEYVKDFDAVLLDAGSTAEFIAEELFTVHKYLSVMTNNMGAYAAYARTIAPLEEGVSTLRTGLMNGNELLLPGGRYDATYEALLGDRTVDAIKTFTPNVIILGVSGLRFGEGVFCHGTDEVRVKHLLWTIPTDTRVIAADWTKIGKRDAHAFGPSVDGLGSRALRAVVVTSKPPRDAPPEQQKAFDDQIRRIQDANIHVDIV